MSCRHYDLRVSKKLAIENAKLWAGQLSELLSGKQYRYIFVNLGRDYMRALPDMTEVARRAADIVTAHGRIGERLHQLKCWHHAIVLKTGPINYQGSNV